MKEEFITYEEFKKMKIPQFASILISKDMACPGCNGSDLFRYEFDKNVVEPTPIGWCDTENGYMACFECPKCFTKFRFHISTTGRNEINRFYLDFSLLYFLYREHQKTIEV